MIITIKSKYSMHLDELTSQTAACYKFLNHWHYVYYYKDLDKIYCYCAQIRYYPEPTVSQLTANEDLHATNGDFNAINGDLDATNGDFNAINRDFNAIN